MTTWPQGSRLRVIIIGIGGASCSGKTTLAKRLHGCIPNSVIIHQDPDVGGSQDFAPPVDKLPIHPDYNIQDWDDPVGAIDWPRFCSFLKKLKETGKVPNTHVSHDHLNGQQDISVSEETVKRWKGVFSRVEEERRREEETFLWVLIDGFLMYWDDEVIDLLDSRILLRVPRKILEERRLARSLYYTAEGTVWRDPPYYFEGIVYPAYVKAHERLFENGDVENGALNEAVDNLVLIEPHKMTADELIELACRTTLEALR